MPLALNKMIGVSTKLQLYASHKIKGRENKCKQNKMKWKIRLASIFKRLPVTYKLSTELPSGQRKQRNKNYQIIWGSWQRKGIQS